MSPQVPEAGANGEVEKLDRSINFESLLTFFSSPDIYIATRFVSTAPPMHALRSIAPFHSPSVPCACVARVAHRLSTSLRPLCLLPARVAPSAGVLDHPLQVPQARIGTRRHHRDRERRDRLVRHDGQQAHRIFDAIVGRASSAACARALYPAHLGDPALAAPCACSRFQQQRQRQQRL